MNLSVQFPSIHKHLIAYSWLGSKLIYFVNYICPEYFIRNKNRKEVFIGHF